MLTESKLDDSLPLGQLLIDGFYAQFRFDCDKNGGWNNVVYIREENFLQVKVFCCNNTPQEEMTHKLFI